MYALTAKGMKFMDEYTINKGVASSALMENAAKVVVDEILRRFPDRSESVLVLVGSGNNGGDAVSVASKLLSLGYDVAIYFAGNKKRASKEFIRQLRLITSSHPDLIFAGLSGSSDAAVLTHDYDIIIDGIYGIGLNRRFGSNFAKFIKYINGKKSYKIAIDIPSGLNATSGQVMNAVLKADLTVTFSAYKTGMFFEAGREACGEIVVRDIGINSAGYGHLKDKLYVCDEEFLNETWTKAIVARHEKSHKGTYGTVGIVVGTSGMLGASILAAKAAYRAGCGLVKIFCPKQFIGFCNVSVPEAVVVPYRNEDVLRAYSEFARSVDAILIGPGLDNGSVAKLLVKQVLVGDVPCVIDAGALNIVAENIKPFSKRNCECVITPHVGEMARLCGESVDIVQKNLIGFTKKFSEIYRVSMVTKSDISVISMFNGMGEQRLFLNTLGNSGLATAGSGDVLAGTIVSLIAQRNTPSVSVLYGTMVHGRAADRLASDEDSKRRMMAGDIIESLF